MKKLFFILVISLNLIVACKADNVAPESQLSTIWDGLSYTQLYSVNGVFEIYYPSQLAWIARNANKGYGFTNETVRLMNNINLSDKDFTGIATAENTKFMGTFDGNGFSIEGLNIKSEDNNVGFIGYLDAGATVKNINISGKIAVNSVGIVRVGGIVGINYGTIVNATNKTLVYAEVSEDYMGIATLYIGGVAGVNNSKILECANNTNVEGYADGINKTGSIGGIAGWLGLEGSVSKCYNSGEILSTDSSMSPLPFAGGLVGNVFSRSAVSILKSYNVTNVNTVNANSIAGGLVGNVELGEVSIEDCYNTGHISAIKQVGGLVGEGDANTDIKNSYNIGIVYGADKDALAYNIKSSSVSIYYINTGSSSVGVGLSVAQFENGSSFNNFSFGDIWTMSKESSETPKRRPVLIGVGYYLPPIVEPPADIPR